MTIKTIPHHFTVCKVADYSMTDFSAEYCFAGKTDEENLGFTYAELDVYIRTGKIADPEKKALIDKKHKANLFKLELMPAFKPSL